MFKLLGKYILNILSIKARIKLISKVRLGYIVNLENPQTFNEKINYRKVSDFNSLMTLCSDKYLVRDYVSNKVGNKYLIPLIYVGDGLNEDVIKNPTKNLVVKTTHDSGSVFFIKKDEYVDYSKLQKKIKKIINYNYGKYNDEPWYSNIKPKVIIEEMLLNGAGEVPEDFKFHVFSDKNGEQEAILQIDYDRFSNHTRNFYDEELEFLNIKNKYNNNNDRKKIEITNYSEMLEIAKKLACSFSYVRVDLYNLKGEIFFGELTFAHETGFGKFENYQTDIDWGNKWA